jgi:hypothetical protein
VARRDDGVPHEIGGRGGEGEDEPEPQRDEREHRDQQDRWCGQRVGHAEDLGHGQHRERRDRIQGQADGLLAVEGHRPSCRDETREVEDRHDQAGRDDEARLDADGRGEEQGGRQPECDANQQTDPKLRGVRHGELGLELSLERGVRESEGQPRSTLVDVGHRCSLRWGRPTTRRDPATVPEDRTATQRLGDTMPACSRLGDMSAAVLDDR